MDGWVFEEIEMFVLCSLRSFHRMKSHCARRLIAAVIDNQPFTDELFKPREQIINSSYRTSH